MSDCIVSRRGGGNSSTGTALPQDVLSGRTFSNKDETGLTGILDVEKGSYLTNSLSEWEVQNCDNSISWKSICYGGGKFVAVSDGDPNLKTMYSTNGTDWFYNWSPAVKGLTSVCYGKNLFVAVSHDDVGDKLVLTSTEGYGWSARSTPKGAIGWKDVCSGDELFVAVSDILTGKQVMTSSNGYQWEIQSTPEREWVSVCYGAGIFVAVAANSDTTKALMTSSDGVKWEIQSIPINTKTSPCACYGKGQFVVVDVDHVITSPDGVHWTLLSVPESSNNWSSVCYGNGLFVTCSTTGSGEIMVSEDGINWVLHSNMASPWMFNGICYGNDVFAAVGNDADGHGVRLLFRKREEVTSFITMFRNLGDWKLRNCPEPNGWKSICYGNDLFVAVAEDGDIDSGKVMISPNGIHWISRNCPDNSWQDVCYGKGVFAAVGGQHLMTSSDGIIWELQKTPDSSSSWGHICYGNGLFIVTGSKKEIMVSSDTVDWELISIPGLIEGGVICYGKGIFIGVIKSEDGYSWRVAISKNGLEWEVMSEYAKEPWKICCFGNDQFIALNGYGVEYSADGIRWNRAVLSERFTSVCYGNDIFVAIQNDGNKIATSSDAINWILQDAPAYGNSVCYGKGRFVVVGSGSVMTAEIHHQLIRKKPQRAVFLGSYSGSRKDDRKIEFNIKSYCDYSHRLRTENFIAQLTRINVTTEKTYQELSWNYDSQTGVLTCIANKDIFSGGASADIYIIG